MRSIRSFLLAALALAVIAPRGTPAPVARDRVVLVSSSVADAPDSQPGRLHSGAVETGGARAAVDALAPAGRSLAQRASAVGATFLALWVTGSLVLGAFWALAGWLLAAERLGGAGSPSTAMLPE